MILMIIRVVKHKLFIFHFSHRVRILLNQQPERLSFTSEAVR